jgi:hypothetical protein
MSRLDSAWAKWERGNVHLDLLVDEMPAWLNANPYGVAHEVNPQGTEYVMRIRHQGGLPPGEWGLIVGDSLSNFRGALDHALYGLASLRAGVDPPPYETDLQFPITIDSGKFEKALKGKQLGDLASDSAVRGAVESVQPYGGVDQDGQPFGLRFLHKLNNAEKHRRIQIVIARISGGGFDVVPPTDPPMVVKGGQLFSMAWHSGPIENGTPLFTWTSDIPFFPSDMKVNQRLVLTPCLRHDLDGSEEYAGVLWVLRRIRDAVERTIRIIEAVT